MKRKMVGLKGPHKRTNARKDVIQTYRDPKTGRFDSRGYAFDANKMLETVKTKYESWGHKLFLLGLVIGFILGAICF